MNIAKMMKEINRMLERNPRAISLVYHFLIGFTGGADHE